MPTLSKEDTIKVYLKIAHLYYDLKLFRKFGLLLRQVKVYSKLFKNN